MHPVTLVLPAIPFISSFTVPLPGALDSCQVDRLSPRDTGFIVGAQKMLTYPRQEVVTTLRENVVVRITVHYL